MKRGAALLVAGMALALALLLAAAGASAEVTVAPAFTILYVKGDDGPNQIAVECLNGVVTVNQAPAANGQVSCVDLQKLRVFGFGGDDTISLTGFGLSRGQLGGAFGGNGSGNEPLFTASGGDGNDVLLGDATGEQLSGNAGNDVISAPGAFVALMSGGTGDDRLFGKSLALDLMAGGPGADRIGGGARLTFALGGSGPDTMVGGGHTDLLVGGAGPDKLAGKGGADLLAGAAGSDVLFGGRGDDTMAGGRGSDRLRGGPGDDKLFQAGFPRHGLGHVPGASNVVAAGPGASGKTIGSRILKALGR